MTNQSTASQPRRPVDEYLATQVEIFVRSNFDGMLTDVSTEIQDDYHFLLIGLTVNGATSVHDALRILEVVTAEVSRKIPPRANENSWMVNLKYGGEILRSVMGGRAS